VEVTPHVGAPDVMQSDEPVAMHSKDAQVDAAQVCAAPPHHTPPLFVQDCPIGEEKERGGLVRAGGARFVKVQRGKEVRK
jgi:hypothetical protein